MKKYENLSQSELHDLYKSICSDLVKRGIGLDYVSPIDADWFNKLEEGHYGNTGLDCGMQLAWESMRDYDPKSWRMSSRCDWALHSVKHVTLIEGVGVIVEANVLDAFDRRAYTTCDMKDEYIQAIEDHKLAKEIEQMEKAIVSAAHERLLKLSAARIANTLDIDTSSHKREIYDAIGQASRDIMDQYGKNRSLAITVETYGDIKNHILGSIETVLEQNANEIKTQMAEACFVCNKPVYYSQVPCVKNDYGFQISTDIVREGMSIKFINDTLQLIGENGLEEPTRVESNFEPVISCYTCDDYMLIETASAIYTNCDFSQQYAQEFVNSRQAYDGKDEIDDQSNAINIGNR